MTTITIATKRADHELRTPRPAASREITRLDLTIGHLIELLGIKERRNDDLAQATWEDAEWQ